MAIETRRDMAPPWLARRRARLTGALWSRLRHWAHLLEADARSTRYVPFGIATALLSALVTLAVYANRPTVEHDPDTVAYVGVAYRILQHGQLVDPARLPGYPLLIAAVFALAGRGNLAAVSAAQGALFVLAIAEVYAVLCLLLRRGWAAFLVALLAGVNTHLLSYVKPILSEGLALFLIASLALAVTLYIRRPGTRRLWLVAGCTLALFLTRPEWIYLPVPLVAYLLFVAYRCGVARRLLPHALAVVVALYAVLGLYVATNGVVNQCACVTYIQNYNLLGKVMQYRMQNEAPPQYAGMTQIVNEYLALGDEDPWDVMRSDYPPLHPHFQAYAGEYSTAIIRAHPVEFVAKSVPVAGDTLTMTTPFLPVAASGASASWLLPLNALAEAIIHTLIVFPLAALLWWALLLRRRRRALSRTADTTIETMAALALLGCYGVALSALGGYVYYPRLHTPYAPLLLVVTWGTLAAVALHLWDRRSAKLSA